MLKVAQLTASRFFGGPERQMIELARHLPTEIKTIFASFSERGSCTAFLQHASDAGFVAHRIKHDMPRLISARNELKSWLSDAKIDLLCCTGYKPDLLGRSAARAVGIPVMSISRGWTAETWRVRGYEMLDRKVLPWMDHVVCVSHEQGRRVRCTGVPQDKLSVIHNAIETNRFQQQSFACRQEILGWFPSAPKQIVVSAGRLSPEKGFDVLVNAAAKVIPQNKDVGFVVFGEGRLRNKLQQQVKHHSIQNRFVFAGFRPDVDRFFPNCDIFALSSYTEGLPNVVLEAMAARLPVVATNVGGTGEVVSDGTTGWLVPPGDATSLAQKTVDLVSSPSTREEMGAQGRARVIEKFSFQRQAEQYCRVFETLTGLTISNGSTATHLQPA